MPKQPSPEAIKEADAFLHELWEGFRPHIDETIASLERVGDAEQILQVTVAQSLVSKWDDLSRVLVRDPRKLSLRELDITRAERALVLPSLAQDEPSTTVSVRYSTVSALGDRIPEGTRLPHDSRRPAPQVRAQMTEMFSDAQRMVLNVLQGMAESQAEASPRVRDQLSEAEAGMLGVMAREFALTGKATWWNTDERRVWTWDLARLRVIVPVSGMTVVRSEVQYGKGEGEVQRYLHGASFNHETLDVAVAGLLGKPGDPGAIETLLRLVQKKLSK